MEVMVTRHHTTPIMAVMVVVMVVVTVVVMVFDLVTVSIVTTMAAFTMGTTPASVLAVELEWQAKDVIK